MDGSKPRTLSSRARLIPKARGTSESFCKVQYERRGFCFFRGCARGVSTAVHENRKRKQRTIQGSERKDQASMTKVDERMPLKMQVPLRGMYCLVTSLIASCATSPPSKAAICGRSAAPLRQLRRTRRLVSKTDVSCSRLVEHTLRQSRCSTPRSNHLRQSP